MKLILLALVLLFIIALVMGGLWRDKYPEDRDCQNDWEDKDDWEEDWEDSWDESAYEDSSWDDK